MAEGIPSLADTDRMSLQNPARHRLICRGQFSNPEGAQSVHQALRFLVRHLSLSQIVQRRRPPCGQDRHYLMSNHLNGSGETLPDAREALDWAAETRVSMVDLKFCDLLGTWQHMTLPLRAFGADAFEEGLGFDGSSIRASDCSRPRASA